MKYNKYINSKIPWVGDIPHEWRVFPLFTQLKKQSVKNLNGKVNNVLSLSYGNIVRRNVETNFGLLPDSFETYQVVKPGNIILRLTDLQNDKKSLRVGLVKEKGIITSAYVCLKPSETMNPNYAYYMLHAYDVCKVFYGQGGGVRQTLKYDELKWLNILLPSLNEQKVIAEFLDNKMESIQKLISIKQKQIDTLQKYRQSLITETVTKGLSPAVKMKNSHVEWIGDIPEHWDLKRLRYLGVLQNGISKSSEHFGHGFPFISYGDVYKNIELPNKVKGLVNSTLSDRRVYSVEKGDVFFTRTSETVQEIGFTSTCLETIEQATFAGFLIRFRPSLNNLLPNYSKYYFRSNIHRNHFAKEMNLVTRASLSQELLKKLPVLLPPKEEQAKIGAYLDEKCFYVETLIKENKQIIEYLEKYKNSLIYEAVTGKIDVRNYKENLSEVKL